MIIRPRPPFLRSAAYVLAGLLALLGTGGCSLFRNLSAGTHLDAERPRPVTTDHRVRTVTVEVTTDAQGQIASINVKRSSGKPGLDGYVTESIRQNWPQQPSMRTVAEVSYSQVNGFSEPKLVSSTPVP